MRFIALFAFHELLYIWFDTLVETRTILSVLRFVSHDLVSDLVVFITLKICSQMYVLPKREICMTEETAEAIAVE